VRRRLIVAGCKRARRVVNGPRGDCSNESTTSALFHSHLRRRKFHARGQKMRRSTTVADRCSATAGTRTWWQFVCALDSGSINLPRGCTATISCANRRNRSSFASMRGSGFAAVFRPANGCVIAKARRWALCYYVSASGRCLERATRRFPAALCLESSILRVTGVGS
jgi:hypothetical protein